MKNLHPTLHPFLARKRQEIKENGFDFKCSIWPEALFQSLGEKTAKETKNSPTLTNDEKYLLPVSRSMERGHTLA